MKRMKKTLIGITTAMVLAGTMIYTAAFAGEAPQQAASQEAEAAVTTFTTQDGVLSIELPQDDEGWKVIDGTNFWFAVGNGTDMITAEHLAAGDPLPAAELANDQFAEIYQMFYSTKDEVFIVTGKIANKDEAQTVKEAVGSFKVLKYGEVQKKNEQPQQQANAGQNISKEDELIADGQIFTGNKMYNMVDFATGAYVILSELNQGGWANEETGEIFFWETTQSGAPGQIMFGDKGTVLWIDSNYNQFMEANAAEDELINGGQIFTGNYMYLYNEYGGLETLSELSQGGWANEETGEIFYRGSAGADFWYGDKGTVLSAERDPNLDNTPDENYYQDENGEFSWHDDEEQGGYAGSNYYEDENGEFSWHDDEEQGGYAGSNYYEDENGEFSWH